MDKTSFAEYSQNSLLAEKLLSEIAGGNKDSLAQLYNLTRTQLWGYILSIVKNSHDAQDLLQDAYIKIFAAAGSYIPQGKPLAWMLTVARNLCYMHLRGGKQHEDISQQHELQAQQGLHGSDEALLLQTALELLAQDEREIIMLHAVSGYKHRETAQFLGLPLSTVLSKYNRALKKMKKLMTEGE